MNLKRKIIKLFTLYDRLDLRLCLASINRESMKVWSVRNSQYFIQGWKLKVRWNLRVESEVKERVCEREQISTQPKFINRKFIAKLYLKLQVHFYGPE